MRVISETVKDCPKGGIFMGRQSMEALRAAHHSSIVLSDLLAA